MRFHLALFIIFGIAFQQLVHTVLEVWYIGLLMKDFKKYGLGLDWSDWFIIHHIGTVILLLLGVWLGHKFGKKYSG